MKRSFVILVFLLFGIVIAGFSQTTAPIPKDEGPNTVEGCIKEFLAGKGCGDVLAYTSGGTFLETAPPSLVIKEAYKNSELIFLKKLIANNGTATLIARTKHPKGANQFHTFVLQKNQSKLWRVIGWHTSHA